MCRARLQARRSRRAGCGRQGEKGFAKGRQSGDPADVHTFMKKQTVKVIKREDGEKKLPSVKKEKPKRKRSMESTVQDWITERRENEDTQDRTRSSQLASWTDDTPPLPD